MGAYNPAAAACAAKERSALKKEKPTKDAAPAFEYRPAAEQPAEETEEKQEEKRFSSRVLSMDTSAEQPDRDRKKLMKKFRKAKHIPSETEVERFTPLLEKGLSQEQVDKRFEQFLFNDVNKK